MQIGYEPYLCAFEDEARKLVETLPKKGKWPCLFTNSDTTGEKDFEEFYTENETLDMTRFFNLGVIQNKPIFANEVLEDFSSFIEERKK